MRIDKFLVADTCDICGGELSGELEPYRILTEGMDLFHICGGCSVGLFWLLRSEGLGGIPYIQQPAEAPAVE